MAVVDVGCLGAPSLPGNLFGLGGSSTLQLAHIAGDGGCARIALDVHRNPTLHVLDAPKQAFRAG